MFSSPMVYGSKLQRAFLSRLVTDAGCPMTPCRMDKHHPEDIVSTGCHLGPCNLPPGLSMFLLNYPDLLFLAFLYFLAFSFSREFLAFLSVFPSFPKGCWGPGKDEKLLVFLCSPCRSQKTCQGNGAQRSGHPHTFCCHANVVTPCVSPPWFKPTRVLGTNSSP